MGEVRALARSPESRAGRCAARVPLDEGPMTDRRAFVQGAAAALTTWPMVIRKALALPAVRASGTIMDVEHVVILMQENRSFDHYFGTLRGVRGFSDPRPVHLPSGRPVWQQPGPDGTVHAPFHLDTQTTSAQWLKSLDHSWK